MSTLAVPAPHSRSVGWPSALAGPAIAALLYLLGAETAFLIGTLSDRIFAPFWPPNVVLFCVFLLVPHQRWWIYLAVIFPAHTIAEIGVGMPFPQLLVAFVTNVAVAMLNATAGRALIGPLPWFDSLRKSCLYVMITALVSPMLVALGGAFVPIVGGGSISQFWTYWAQWFVSNAVSSLALGPLVLTWLAERDLRGVHIPARAAAEATTLAIGLFIVCAAVFESGRGAAAAGLLPSLLYLPLPLIIWAAVRFGTRGASGAILVVAVALLWRALKGPSPFMAETPEASVFAIQAFLIGLSVPALLLGAAIDETRRAERTIRTAEERMAFAAVAADLCMWHFNYRSEQFWITDYGCRMWGFAPGQPVTRQTILDTIHPEDRQLARNTIRSATLSTNPIDTEFRIVRKDDGQVRWIRARARADRDDNGDMSQVSGTFSDITNQKATESELLQQRRDLAHLMRVSMLGGVSGSIAHELTQPLTAILSNAQAARIMLDRENPDIEKIAAALDDIIAEDSRAGDVIHHMRRMMRKSETKLEPVDVNQLINSSLGLLHSEFVARRIKCTCDLAKEMPAVSGDPVQLQQVFLNLILNAMEAMNEVSPARRKIAIRTRVQDGGKISIRIIDRGIGVAPANEEKIFQPFFSTKERGLGLGLAICSSIIKLHGGTLNLVNNATEGATAALVIPSDHGRLAALQGGIAS
jgi:PAS domain S-box-containing protein